MALLAFNPQYYYAHRSYVVLPVIQPPLLLPRLSFPSPPSVPSPLPVVSDGQNITEEANFKFPIVVVRFTSIRNCSKTSLIRNNWGERSTRLMIQKVALRDKEKSVNSNKCKL
jgi:hypothetical protein